MESAGFALGVMGFIFGAAALNKVTSLKKEFDELKNKFENSGTIKNQTVSEKK